ncbi:MAG: nucleotidyl transferase AbiEii/AbiGii toxin family protein [Myxococcales bacterium]
MPKFRRAQHQAVEKLAQALDRDFLLDAQCFLGGGTQVALTHGEYRESLDLDFLCSSRSGYRKLRETVTEGSLGKILARPVRLARDVRIANDGIRAVLDVDGHAIKVEFILEARLDLHGTIQEPLHLPTLDFDLVVAEEFLANTDRGLDDATFSRDLVDLAYLAYNHGLTALRPGLALARDAYGKKPVDRCLGLSLAKVTGPGATNRIAKSLGIDDPAPLRSGLSRLKKLLVRDVER